MFMSSKQLVHAHNITIRNLFKVFPKVIILGDGTGGDGGGGGGGGGGMLGKEELMKLLEEEEMVEQELQFDEILSDEHAVRYQSSGSLETCT
nr:hypothetical protein [Tanacetum cinerariifolium]